MKILTSKNDFKFSFSVKLYLILLHLHQASLEQQQGLSHHGLPHGLGRPLPLRRSVDPVSLIFLIKLWTAMREHSKLGCSFQILYAFQPFSLKSFSMTAFCLSVKTILLRSSELGNCETSERRPVTSTDFDLHCNGFLHCHDFFTRQRRKKTN